MFDSIVDYDNLALALKHTLKSKQRHNLDAIDFLRDEHVNLLQLQSDLQSAQYEPQEYIRFYVRDPKRRLIYAPKHRDKIVHHAINNILHEKFKRMYISDSYACIKGRGQDAAIKKITDSMKCAHRLWGAEATILHVDIERFFYSIDHTVVKHIVDRKIPCARTKALIKTIIDSSPTNPGLPLGNLMSQSLANLYMNELDQFAKRKLGLKYYVRYADDIVVILKDRKSATVIKRRLAGFLSKVLKLRIHPRKTKIVKLINGITALGFKLTLGGILLSNHAKRRKYIIKKRLNRESNYRKQRALLKGWTNHIKRARSDTYLHKFRDELYHSNLRHLSGHVVS